MDPLSYWLHVHSKRLGISRQIVSCSEDSEGESGNSSNDGGTEDCNTGCTLIAVLCPSPIHLGICCWFYPCGVQLLLSGNIRIAFSLIVLCHNWREIIAIEVKRGNHCWFSRISLQSSGVSFRVDACGSCGVGLGASPAQFTGCPVGCIASVLGDSGSGSGSGNGKCNICSHL